MNRVRHEKVLVLGGGVIGLSIAWRLRQRGFPVTIVDRGPPGAEASSAAGGILGPQLECHRPGPFLELCLRSRTLYPAFVRELEAASGISVGYRESGLLQLAFDDEALQDLADTAAWQRAFQLRAEVLDPSELHALEPNASPDALGALWLPDDHQVEPRLLVSALIAACERVNVTFLRAEIESLTHAHGQVHGARTSAGLLQADRVIVAMGAWSGRLDTPPLALPVEPVRGQIVELRGEPDTVRHLLHAEGVYLVPRKDGRILIGSTTEHVGFEKGTTEAGIASLVNAAKRVCPALHAFPVYSQWSGLRPATTDHLPLLCGGPLTGLVLATGHFRNGILLAPITARAVSDILDGNRTVVDLKPFELGRFSLPT